MYVPSEKKEYKCYKYKELIIYYDYLEKNWAFDVWVIQFTKEL